jgi:hypothetical protein
MIGWLHLTTVLLTLSKWAGLFHATWAVVFLPSLLYGALVLLIVGIGTVFVLADGAIYQTSLSLRHGLHQR